jgi:hypothetical protein
MAVAAVPDAEAQHAAGVAQHAGVAAAAARHAAGEPEGERAGAAVLRAGVAVRAARGVPRAARDVRQAALPSARACHPWEVRVPPAPSAAGRSGRATRRLRIATPSTRWWQAARAEVLS